MIENVAALGARVDLRREQARLRNVEFGNRTQQPAPVPEHDAHGREIAIRNLGKNIEINAVVGKGLQVLREADLLQPGSNLPSHHAGSSILY